MRPFCIALLAASVVASTAQAAPVKAKSPAKKPAVVKPPAAPPKGKAIFPKQQRRRPAGKIVKILPGDRRVDPKALATAPTANQVAAKKAADAIVKPPKPAPKAKQPIKASKSSR